MKNPPKGVLNAESEVTCLSKGDKKKKPCEIKTKKLVLRALDNDELLKRRYEYTDFERQRAYADMCAGCDAQAENRLWYTAWAATLKENGEYIGDLYFKGKPENREAEIAYFLADKFKDSEVAGEAVNELAEWGFANSDDLYFVAVFVDEQSDGFATTLDNGDFSVVEETETMLKFERVRAQTSWMAVGMCLGVGIGSGIGLIFDNLAMGMSLGISASVAFGLLVDVCNKKKREKILREHRGETSEDEE